MISVVGGLIVDDFAWLTEWYASQCNGDWEHTYGVNLTNLDNPGWSLTVDLEDTDLEKCAFAAVEHNLTSDVSWWTCRVKDNKFEAQCGSRDLLSVLAIFRVWAESPS